VRKNFDRDAMRVGLRLAGAVAVSTGLSVMMRGTKAIPGGGPVPSSVDNVLRFYAAWWVGSGVLMWHVAPDTRRYDGIVKGILGVNFAGGLARLHSAHQSGGPHVLFRVIAIEELLISPVMYVLQRRIARSR
jgi:hypothetical protein